VQDARRHGVVVRPVDVTVSEWECTLEKKVGSDSTFPARATMTQALGEKSSLPPLSHPALRLGLRMISGFSEAGAQRLVAAQRAQPFLDVADLAHRAALDRRDLARLADAD